uniref:Uncharacterized protein n=1 Tax=Panagrolaimus sp. ES5 TaxID=591445 RepID=A0AC34GCX4_9BILA
TKDSFNKEALLKHFLNPVFNEIVQNRFPRLKEIMEEWIKKHEYAQLLKTHPGMEDIEVNIKKGDGFSSSRKRRFRDITVVEESYTFPGLEQLNGFTDDKHFGNNKDDAKFIEK